MRTSGSYSLEDRFFGMVATSTFEPHVLSITPNWGYNNVTCEVVIRGMNISSDATASLESAAYPNINGANVTVDASGTSLECGFDLNNAPIGKRDVVVTNTGWNKTGKLVNGFEVRSPGLAIHGLHNYPNPFDPNHEVTHIEYTLTRSATLVYYLFNQTGAIIWHRTFPSGDIGGTVGENLVTWDGRTDFGEGAPTGVYVLIINAHSNGKELGRLKMAVLRQ